MAKNEDDNPWAAGSRCEDKLDLPEVKQLQAKVATLEETVESIKREMVTMRLRQYFIKAIIGWKEGEKAPLSKNKLKGLRELAEKLGITV